ncbi:MAG TPA: prepilin-type N-terminal cleavage/methylation domain-containing protein [Planctomycetota bacterium]|nr:prepilin-type N-terminal cleavage/methylation domain-containing protein [Planctomycetota bacterium]
MRRGFGRSRKGFTLIELMIVIAIIAIIAAIAIPGLLSSQRASNERNSSTSLKTLTSAEADFRANDRDWNHINDFWTADVKGLYTMTSAAVSGASNSTIDPAIKLIELSIASADSDGTKFSCNDNCELTLFAIYASKAGYWYQALAIDQALAGSTEATYKTDTGGTPSMGSCHNTSKFGFMSYPDSQSSGKYVYVVNENNTIFRSATSGTVKTSTTNPPGVITTASYKDFPSDGNLKSYWSKLD